MARNWMNDPNGPIYFNGRYHMFFQYNPEAAVWGNMGWGHAVSEDMMRWRHLPVAMTPTPGGPDSYGVFSGSAIAVGERIYVVYTGTQISATALATIRGDAKPIEETQCLAWSDDPMLVKVDEGSGAGGGAAAGGDEDYGVPRSFGVAKWRWVLHDGWPGVEDEGGCVLLYRSRDLKSWEYLHKLASGTWDGKKTTNPCDDGEMWECPDFLCAGWRACADLLDVGKGVLGVGSAGRGLDEVHREEEG